VPPQTPIVLAPRRPRVALIAAVAASCVAAAAGTSVIAEKQPAAGINAITEPSQPAASRYFDIEANKAASMRALGRHMAERRAHTISRYEDIEANKARSQRTR